MTHRFSATNRKTQSQRINTMSTDDSNDSNITHDQIEPFPTDGKKRDYEAAEAAIGLSYQSVFAIGDHVFEYRGLNLGEAVVRRLSESSKHTEEIPFTELWEAHQRGNLEFGEWRCQFIAEEETHSPS
jgi:hypothetical protein